MAESSTHSAFVQAAFQHLESAAAGDLPLFQPDVKGSNPLNSSPYLIGFKRCREIFGGTPRREALLDRLTALLSDLHRSGGETIAIMIGGSMVDRARVPKDLDCVLFYRPVAAPGDIGKRIAETAARYLPQGIDARFVPVDSDPLVLIKMTSYFTSLYSASRSGEVRRFGHLLVLPDL